MRSKEDISDIIADELESGKIAIPNNITPDAYYHFLCMDEWAKEVHFAYKEWIDKIVRDGGEQMKKLKDVNDKELFNQFIQSIKQ